VTEILAAKDVSHQFESLPIIRQVSLSVRSGEIVSLVGPSGSGKTTLLRIIAGLLQPTAGAVFREGVRVTGPSRHCLLVDQGANLFPWMRCIDHVKFGLARPLPANWRATAEGLLAEVGLAGFENRFPSQLSGGMKQRLALARAIAASPAILLLDEPFSALDIGSRQTISDLVSSLVAKQLVSAVLLVSHDIRDAVYLGDRILISGNRPAEIVDEISVPFDRPRNHDVKLRSEFRELQAHIESELVSFGATL
jgi:NitT/TauT family transport system ATP-binding protein